MLGFGRFRHSLLIVVPVVGYVTGVLLHDYLLLLLVVL